MYHSMIYDLYISLWAHPPKSHLLLPPNIWTTLPWNYSAWGICLSFPVCLFFQSFVHLSVDLCMLSFTGVIIQNYFIVLIKLSQLCPFSSFICLLCPFDVPVTVGFCFWPVPYWHNQMFQALIFSAVILEAAISSKSPRSFYWRILETKIRALGCTHIS